jgi:chaperonin GroEL
MLERKDRLEDALCASRVAIRDGIIPGGGSVLYDGSFLFAEDSSVAGKIMFQALQAPFKQIVANAGFDPREIIAKSEYSEDAIGTIFDASTGSFVDRRDSGIIDPAHVTKSALENAVSIAGLLLTTGGALVADKESADGTPNPLAGLMG